MKCTKVQMTNAQEKKKQKKKTLKLRNEFISLMNWHKFYSSQQISVSGKLKIKKKMSEKKTMQIVRCLWSTGKKWRNQPSDLSSFTAVISVPDFDRMSLIQFCLLRTLIITKSKHLELFSSESKFDDFDLNKLKNKKKNRFFYSPVKRKCSPVTLTTRVLKWIFK